MSGISFSVFGTDFVEIYIELKLVGYLVNIEKHKIMYQFLLLWT